jgi:hypothetical protein
MPMKRLEFSVDSAAILKEIERQFSSGSDADSPGMVMACQQIRIGLARIAGRAIALNDDVLIKELQRLGAVKEV